MEHYLVFKIAEEWRDVMHELEVESLLPVPKDRKRIQEILKASEGKAIDVKEFQKKLLLMEDSMILQSIQYK